MGPSHPILLLTGPPGAGKTTVARLLALRFPRAVHLESDSFFHFIAGGYIEPWRAEAHEQNVTVMGIVAEAASGYARADYFTIVDRIFIPGWFFEPLRDSLIARGNTVAYAVLRAPLTVCETRSSEREREPLPETDALQRLWNAFADVGDLEHHVVPTDGANPTDIAGLIARNLDGLHSSPTPV